MEMQPLFRKEPSNPLELDVIGDPGFSQRFQWAGDLWSVLETLVRQPEFVGLVEARAGEELNEKIYHRALSILYDWESSAPHRDLAVATLLLVLDWRDSELRWELAGRAYDVDLGHLSRIVAQEITYPEEFRFIIPPSPRQKGD